MEIIELTQNYIAFISDEDYIYLNQFSWQALLVPNSNNVYAMCQIKRKTIYMHIEVLKRMGIVIPKGMEGDHKNRDTLDNQRDNLRLVTKSINHHNSKDYKNNTSGTKGVRYVIAKRKWSAVIEINKNRIFIGYYLTYEEAVIARKNIEKKYAKQLGTNNKGELQ